MEDEDWRQNKTVTQRIQEMLNQQKYTDVTFELPEALSSQQSGKFSYRQ